MFLSVRECRSLQVRWMSKRVTRSQTATRTLADALAEQVEQLVQHASEHVKVEREEVDQVAQRLDHGRREPHAHVLVGAEPRDVRS